MMMSENDQRMELGRVIGKNIRRLRDEAGLSQRAFAEIVQNAGLNAWSTARLSNAETSPVSYTHLTLPTNREV